MKKAFTSIILVLAAAAAMPLAQAVTPQTTLPNQQAVRPGPLSAA